MKFLEKLCFLANQNYGNKSRDFTHPQSPKKLLAKMALNLIGTGQSTI